MTELDLILRALASPIRLRILAVLFQLRPGDRHPAAGPSALAVALRLARPTVSGHLKILLRSGLVRYWKSGRNKFYTLPRLSARSLRGRLLERLKDEFPAELPAGFENRPTGRKAPDRRRSRPPRHGEIEATVLGPVWLALTAYSNFRRLLMLRALRRRPKGVSARELKTATDLDRKTVKYHLSKLLRRNVIEACPGGFRLVGKGMARLGAFVTALLGRALARAAA